jgi:hypothetical protein
MERDLGNVSHVSPQDGLHINTQKMWGVLIMDTIYLVGLVVLLVALAAGGYFWFFSDKKEKVS